MPETNSTTTPVEPYVPDFSLLERQDICRLTLFKWRYSLESAGFTTQQSHRLLFLKWLAAQQPVEVR